MTQLTVASYQAFQIELSVAQLRTMSSRDPRYSVPQSVFSRG